VIFCDSSEITPDHLTLSGQRTGLSRTKQLQQFDRQHLEQTLVRTRGNIAAAARLLGLSRSTLYDRLKKLDIQRGSF
jgi:two-component system NtrC family response regulator